MVTSRQPQSEYDVQRFSSNIIQSLELEKTKFTIVLIYEIGLPQYIQHNVISNSKCDEKILTEAMAKIIKYSISSVAHATRTCPIRSPLLKPLFGSTSLRLSHFYLLLLLVRCCLPNIIRLPKAFNPIDPHTYEYDESAQIQDGCMLVSSGK